LDRSSQELLCRSHQCVLNGPSIEPGLAAVAAAHARHPSELCLPSHSAQLTFRMDWGRGKTGVTADGDKIEFRLFNSSSIFNITLRVSRSAVTPVFPGRYPWGRSLAVRFTTQTKLLVYSQIPQKDKTRNDSRSQQP